MLLRFNTPINVPLHFTVPADNTPWDPQIHAKNTQGWTPVRLRATYSSWRTGLVPSGAFQHWDGQPYPWDDVYGLYLFAADLPHPTLYVGIASNDSNKPEGVLTRLKKHRVKATGSHVGAGPATTGGVHHPEAWRKFAASRFVAVGGAGDTLDDVRFVVAAIAGVSLQRKSDLERFEGAIISNQNGILDAIKAKLWPHGANGQVTVVNGTSGSSNAADGVEAGTKNCDGQTISINSEDQVLLW